MALDTFDRQLRLMMLLTGNRHYSLDDLKSELKLSERSLFRYLQLFKDFGFIVSRRNGLYSLDKESPYFRQLAENISFTEEEVITLKRLLQGARYQSPEVVFLLKKLSRVYDAGAVEIIPEDEIYVQNYRRLYQAVKEGRQVILKDYSSGHSRQCSDRWVEPYAFISNNTMVRCFEIRTAQNKSFAISRVGEVEVLPISWEFQTKHTMVYTDAFRFSGEIRYPIRLRLNRLAMNLLREEFAISSDTLSPDDDEHWLYTDQVCSYVGVGRFILGLPGDVEVLENDELKAYLRQQILKF